LATAAGPVIGGLILAVFTGSDGWRWVFHVNVPIGVVALLLALRFVPALARGCRRPQLDLFGSLLLGSGVLSLLLPLVNSETGGVTKLWPLPGLAVLLLGGFL
jgi:MFS family permease